jgi:hypothetical protein
MRNAIENQKKFPAARQSKLPLPPHAILSDAVIPDASDNTWETIQVHSD